MINYKDLKIFNLIDEKFPFRTIQNIYFASVSYGNILENMFKEVRKTPAANKAVIRYLNSNYDYLSSFALIATGILISTVKKINEEFNSIEQIETEMERFFNFGYTRTVINKTIDFIHYYRLYESLLNKEISMLILRILEDEKIIANDKLYEKIVSIKYFGIAEYDEAINELLKNNVIILTGNGYRKKLYNLKEYLSLYPDNNKKILYRYLAGDKTSEIIKGYNFTRQRLHQIIDKEIEDYPIFENEEKYLSLLTEYEINIKYLKLLGLTDSMLIEYISLKYKFKERKNIIEYIVDYGLTETPIGQDIFIKENKIFYNKQVYELSFDNLVKKYVEENNLKYFNAEEIYNDYNSFLKKINLENEIKDSIDIFCRSLDWAKDFLNYGNKNYYYLKEEDLNVDFYIKTEEYLDNFYGYAYMNHLYNKFEETFLQNKIYDPRQLFAIMKHIYGYKFKNKIRFIRIPTFATNGITKDEFLLEKVEELQPIKIDKFAEILEKEYGHPKDDFNFSNSRFINKYVNKDGYLTIEGLTVSNEEKDIFDSIVNGNVVIATDYYNSQLDKYNKEIKVKLKNSQTLRVLGYRIVSNGIYKNNFSNYEEAMMSLFNELPIRLTKDLLFMYMNTEQFEQTRYQVVFNNNMLIEYEKNIYMNIVKRGVHKEVLNFKKELINELNPTMFYTLKKVTEEFFYINLLNKYEEVRTMINSYGLIILENIITSSLELTSFKTGTLIFSKDMRASRKEIIRYHIQEEKSIYRDDLEYLLNDEYMMDITLTRSYINELGYFYDLSKDRIYDSKERADKETIQYFMREENGNEY